MAYGADQSVTYTRWLVECRRRWRRSRPRCRGREETAGYRGWWRVQTRRWRLWKHGMRSSGCCRSPWTCRRRLGRPRSWRFRTVSRGRRSRPRGCPGCRRSTVARRIWWCWWWGSTGWTGPSSGRSRKHNSHRLSLVRVMSCLLSWCNLDKVSIGNSLGRWETTNSDIAERPRCRVSGSVLAKSGRRHAADIIGLSSATVTLSASKAISNSVKKKQNKGYYVAQGHFQGHRRRCQSKARMRLPVSD